MATPPRNYALSVHNNSSFRVLDTRAGTVLRTQSVSGKILSTNVSGNVGTVTVLMNGQTRVNVYDLDRNTVIRTFLA